MTISAATVGSLLRTFLMLTAVGGAAWWVRQPPEPPLTVFEGGWVGFKAISCGPTVCVAPNRYCMKFRGGVTWCVDEYHLYDRCGNGENCILIEALT